MHIKAACKCKAYLQLQKHLNSEDALKKTVLSKDEYLSRENNKEL